MKSLREKYLRWKLRRVIAALAHRTSVHKSEEDGVYAFAKMLEATEIMTRGMKKDEAVTMTPTREELVQFIRYMTTLHDSRLSLIIRARIGLATLAMKDEKILGESPKDTLATEEARRIKGSTLNVVDPTGKKIKVNA